MKCCAVKIVVVASLFVTPLAGSAQTGTPGTYPIPEDVTSIDGVVSAIYASISGGVGEPRQWDRFRSLFHPEARIWHTDGLNQGRADRPVPVSVEEYIGQVGYAERLGFRETEVHRTVQQFGTIAQVFSTYEYATEQGDMRGGGINSFQLFFDGLRYWVTSSTWSAETPTSEIPAAYRATPEATRAVVADELLADLRDVRLKFLSLAEAIPESAYGWRPEEGVRSVGEVFAHVAGGTVVVAQRGGINAPPPEWFARQDPLLDKESIVRALGEAFNWLEAELSVIDEAALEMPTEVFGRSSTTRAALAFALAHAHEHLGQSISYARMNGITPPWSG